MSLSKEEKKNLFVSGNVQEVKQFLKDNPTWDVNEGLDGDDCAAPHLACVYGQPEIVSALLANPQTNINQKNKHGSTPFLFGCRNGEVEVVKVLLRDSRVDMNLPDNRGCTPLWWASYFGDVGDVEVIKWMIASGRDLDLDTKGNDWQGNECTAIEFARRESKTGVVSLLERFTLDQEQTRHEIRVELGLIYKDAAELFAMTVFLCDGFLRIGGPESNSEVGRFFRIASLLPMELQMMLCHRAYGLAKENIPSKDSEPAFKSLAKTCV